MSRSRRTPPRGARLATPSELGSRSLSERAELLVVGSSVARRLLRPKRMALSADEREIVSDLIHSVRTLAAHVMTLHLQLGAVRTLLARKGTISDAEVQAAFAELNIVASAEEVLSLTSTDAVFDGLLERLDRAA